MNEPWTTRDRAAAGRGATPVVMNGGPEMTGAHRLSYGMGTRLAERETRTVEGHTRPLLAFGYEVGDGTVPSTIPSIS